MVVAVEVVVGAGFIFVSLAGDSQRMATVMRNSQSAPAFNLPTAANLATHYLTRH